MRSLAVLVALVAALGCNSKDPRARARAAARDFWPDAPAVTRPDARRALRYQVARLPDYRLTIDVRTVDGSPGRLAVHMALGLALGDGPEPNSRAARVSELALDLGAMDRETGLKLEGDALTVRQGGEARTFRRGEGGLLDVDAFLDQPLTTLSIGDDRTVRFAPNRDHPLHARGGDMMDTALVLFPDLPPGEVTAGHTWSVDRNVRLGQGGSRTDVHYDLRYLGDGPCPSGAPTCAVIALEAASERATAHARGTDVTVAYAFAGKIYLDVERGVLDESRLYLHMEARTSGTTLRIGGTYRVTPVAP